MSKKKQPKQTKQTVSYDGMDLVVHFAKYSNGRLAAVLKETSGEAYCSISVNVAEESAKPNCIFLNADNKGMLDAMVEAGVLKPTGRIVPAGHTDVPECEIVEPWLSEAREAE